MKEELNFETTSSDSSHLDPLKSKELNMDAMARQRFEWQVTEEKIVSEVDESKSKEPLLLPRAVDKENKFPPSSSSTSSRKSQTIMRHTKDLFIYGNTQLCEVTTCTYRFRDKKIKQHYVTAISKSTYIKSYTGLRLYDELLSVNGKKLEGRKQKKVISIFRNIRPSRSGGFELKLTLRCWREESTGPAPSTIITVNLNLLIKPEKEQKQMIVHSKPLLQGNVLNIRFTSVVNSCVKIYATKASEIGKQYIFASVDGVISVGNLSPGDAENAHISAFNVMYFQGNDANVMPFFGCILYFEVNRKKMYMTSGLSKTSNKYTLLFKQLPDIKDTSETYLDERFFLLHENGDLKILESMLNRGQCVHYEADTNTLNMQFLTTEQIENMNQTTCGDFVVDIFQIKSMRQLSRQG
ncbi:hypothetical protein ACJMK2_019263 [Sinanodonta woodiana]|uniref:Uncharacterized protein n=1 Tax=Sinanodonta woodiana TaxID=1069815 RepID=A0ABD3UG81_SINWO